MQPLVRGAACQNLTAILTLAFLEQKEGAIVVTAFRLSGCSAAW